jgi:hypothetical protein
MKCTDCKSPTPGPDWRRCPECAMDRLHVIVGGRIKPRTGSRLRRYVKGDAVLVRTEPLVESFVPGKIARNAEGERYVVELDGGGRAYVNITDLREPS